MGLAVAKEVSKDVAEVWHLMLLLVDSQELMVAVVTIVL